MQVQANWENHLLDVAGQISHPHTHPFFSYWAGDAALQNAYKQAEKITAEHSKSFHFASALLPEEKRSAVRALYAFCRTVDDIVDESLDGRSDSQLEYWRTMAWQPGLESTGSKISTGGSPPISDSMWPGSEKNMLKRAGNRSCGTIRTAQRH